MKNEDAIREAIDDLEHGVEVGNIIFQMPEDEKIIAIIMLALEKQIPLKVIKTNTVSQACQVCKFSVNWKYCPECGQKLEY